MAYDVTEDLDAFRAEVRDWLEANCPPSMRTPMKDDEIVWGGRKGEFVNPDSTRTRTACCRKNCAG